MRRLRLILWALVAIAALATLYLAARPDPQPPLTKPMAMTPIGGPFTLVGSDGRPFPSSRLGGRPHALFFGFTHCPDVCPTTLARLVRMRRDVPGGDKAFEIVFVSVDPERDTPTEMARFTTLFDTPIVALTGSVAQVEQVKKQFGIFSEKVPDGKGGYSVDHTATVLLFGRDGKLAGTIAHEEGDPAAIAKLTRLAR